jgi:hypothetical protein
VTDPADGDAEGVVLWMGELAGQLAAAGFDARLHETRAGVDLTAIRRVPGGRDVEAVIDEDGYVEVRFWAEPGASPVQVAAAINRVLAAITGGVAQ